MEAFNVLFLSEIVLQEH